jgi:hypothetical protein
MQDPNSTIICGCNTALYYNNVIAYPSMSRLLSCTCFSIQCQATYIGICNIQVRQWSNVEAAAIEVCNKRARGNAALGIHQGPVAGQGRKSANQLLADRLEARRKGSMSNMYAEGGCLAS